MAEAQIVVDVEASLSKISESIQQNTLWGNTNVANNFTIFRTPHSISQSKKNFFEPSVISIGPFHRGRKHLRTLEEQKWRFLQDFLSRGKHKSLNFYISEMILLEKRTRRCYSETVDLDSNAFVEMILLDGCFVLELFLKLSEGKLNSIFQAGWNSYFLFVDILLLENQIPFFIVEKLYEIGLGEEDSIPDTPAEIHHLVHLCYHYVVPKPEEPVVLSSKSFDFTRMFNTNKIKGLLTRRFRHLPSRTLSVSLQNSTRKISSMVIPSATELKLKGVKFTTKSNPKHMLDISFEYGVLKIPRLAIGDETKPIFANLIAFEHSKFRKKDSHFVSFVRFLDNVVNTPNDVTILQECGIIENLLSSEEELTQFINQVTEFADFSSNHYLAKLYTEVNRYSESSWNRHRANLVRDYFSSPWTAISLVAALILLVLTCVQSFYAIYAYKFPPSS